MAVNKKISELIYLDSPTGNEVVPAALQGMTYKIPLKSIAKVIDKAVLGLDKVDNTSDMDKPISTLVGLELAKKAETGHSHTTANITDLQSVLATKADVSHTHAIADMTGLQVALDGKATKVHGHEITDVNGLQAALNTKSDTGHTHVMANITDLAAAMDAKSNVGHTHAIADVINLQAELDGRSVVGHTHTAANITDFSTAIAAHLSANNIKEATIELGVVQW